MKRILTDKLAYQVENGKTSLAYDILVKNSITQNQYGTYSCWHPRNVLGVMIINFLEENELLESLQVTNCWTSHLYK